MNKIWLKNYQPGVPSEINPDIYPSLVALFHESCVKFANKPAFSNLGSVISYREMAKLTRAFAAYLQQVLQLKKGDRVVLMLPNVMQYPIALFGALQAGLIVVNLNPLYTVSEFVHQVNDAGAETIVVLANFAHVVQEALPQTQLKNIIVTELGDLFAWPKAFIANAIVKYVKKMVPQWLIPNAISFKELLAQGRKLNFSPVTIAGSDIAFLQYTGGTTGVAKGAILTHRNMVANVEQVVAWIRPVLIEGQEVVITALPLYHIFSLTANCLSFIRFGALNVLITNPRDIPRFVTELAKTPFTAITGVNTLFNALLNHPNFAKLDFARLKVALGGGASVQRSVAERWQTMTGKVLLEGYGLTEASPVVAVTPLNLTKYKGTIGLPIASTDIQLIDEQGHEVSIGQTGELCIKGPQVMRGYWQNPAETSKVLAEDGWLKTGDIARVDEDGFIYLVERKKDMILVSGFNVYPNEVEDVIAGHPGILEVAVVGVNDEHSGEIVKAFIVKKDPSLTAEEVKAYCRTHLTAYKIPKQIEFCESLPKSPVGKILRRLLRPVATSAV